MLTLSFMKNVFDAVDVGVSVTDAHGNIIYVNAESGEQEKILLLLEDENGSLTI